MTTEKDDERRVALIPTQQLEPAVFSLVPRDLREAIELSKIMAESDLVPKDFKGKPGNVLIAVQMGGEVGLSPMASIQGIAVVNGRPSLWGDAGKGLLKKHKIIIKEDDIPEIKRDGVARCTITRPGEAPVTRSFSIDDAKTARLWGKDGPWTTSPYRQLAWRAFWFCARDTCPDILKGLYAAEEVVDYEEIREPRNITAAEIMPQSRTEAATARAGEANPTPPPREAVAASATRTTFEIKGTTYETAGITKEQLLETFRLAPLVQAKQQSKNAAAKLLLDEFSVNTRTELTEETAARYIARLKWEAGEEGGEDKQPPSSDS